MNDPSTPTAVAAADKNDEPPSRIKNLWAKAKERWRGKAEIAALHEAVDELIEQSETNGGAPALEREFLDNVLSMRDKDVCDCMVPRAQIVALDLDSDLKSLTKLMTEHSHSRIPVYRDTLDDVVGMIHMKDVLGCLALNVDCPIRDLIRPVLFAAPSMPASKLLLQMRQTRQHMAMVIDEFGGVDGLVTIEDLVEEIVGEIEDEHDDPATADIVVRADGSMLVNAMMEIESFEARLGPILTPEERETIDTVAGYVFHVAGHVPKIGEKIVGAGGIEFVVLETDQNRIKRLRVRAAQKTESA